MPNKVFAWFEYFTSLVKIFVFLLIIVLSLALVLGAGPNGFVHNGDTWTRLPPFLNGFTVSGGQVKELKERMKTFRRVRSGSTKLTISKGIRKLRYACHVGSGRPSLHRHYGW